MTGKEFLRIGKDSLFKDIKSKEKNIKSKEKDIKSKEKNINTESILTKSQEIKFNTSKFDDIIKDNWITELYSKSDSFRKGFPFTPLYCFEDQDHSYQICIYKNVNNKFKVFISKDDGDRYFEGLYLDNVDVEFDILNKPFDKEADLGIPDEIYHDKTVDKELYPDETVDTQYIDKYNKYFGVCPSFAPFLCGRKTNLFEENSEQGWCRKNEGHCNYRDPKKGAHYSAPNEVYAPKLKISKKKIIDSDLEHKIPDETVDTHNVDKNNKYYKVCPHYKTPFLCGKNTNLFKNNHEQGWCRKNEGHCNYRDPGSGSHYSAPNEFYKPNLDKVSGGQKNVKFDQYDTQDQELYEKIIEINIYNKLYKILEKHIYKNDVNDYELYENVKQYIKKINDKLKIYNDELNNGDYQNYQKLDIYIPIKNILSSIPPLNKNEFVLISQINLGDNIFNINIYNIDKYKLLNDLNSNLLELLSKPIE